MDALSIPAVLSTVLSNLDISTIAWVCRLVNSTWNYECCKILGRRVTITFSCWEQLQKYCKTFPTSVQNDSPWGLKLTSFHFCSDLFISAIENVNYGDLNRLQEAFQQFATIHGESVISLKVSLYPMYPCDDNTVVTHFALEQLQKMVYNWFLNVQQLKILFMVKPLEPVSEESQIQVTKLHKMIPNLENLRVDVTSIRSSSADPYEVDTDDHEEMVTGFIKSLLNSAIHINSFSSTTLPTSVLFRDSGDAIVISSQKLRSIDVLLSVTNDEKLISIANHNFTCLQNLQLEIDTENVTFEAVKLFFSQFRNTLRNLHLVFSNKSSLNLPLPIFPPEGVVMPNLEILSLENYNGSLDWKRLPNLKSLSVQTCIDLNLLLYSHTYSKSDSLKKLMLKKGCKCEVDTLVRIIVPLHFSDLHILRISHLQSLQLTKIFECCVKLKELSVLKCGKGVVTDENICGMGTALLRRVCPLGGMLREESAYVKKFVADARENFACCRMLQELPSIANLKDLRVLELEGEFTEMAVLFGIIKCERLQNILLQSHFITWRSDAILKCELRDLICFKR